MKFELTFKTPNVTDAINYQIGSSNCDAHLDQFNWDCEVCLNERHNGRIILEAARKLANKFVKYDEYVRIEFDTDTGTARVIPAKQSR